jgi:hypothetical protein
VPKNIERKIIKLTIISVRGVCSMNLVGDGIDSTNAHKHTKCKEEPMEPVKNLLARGSRSIFSMVIDPTVRRKNDGKRGEAHSSGNGAHPTKDRNTFWEYKTKGSQAPDGAKPSGPVDKGVGLEMLRITEDSYKDVFSREMQVNAAWDNKPNEGNAIGDLLHEPTSAS